MKADLINQKVVFDCSIAALLHCCIVAFPSNLTPNT